MTVKEKMIQRLNDLYVEFLVNLTVQGIINPEDCILHVFCEYIEDTINSKKQYYNN